MYGNRLGWIVAAVLALLIGPGVWRLAGVNRLTPPTTLLAAASPFTPLTLEVPPASIVPAGGNDATPCRQAIAAVRQDPDACAALERSTDADAIEAAAAVKPLLDAAPFVAVDVLAADAAKNVGYEASDDLDALLTLGRLLGRAAVLRGEGNGNGDAAGERDFAAQFSLGATLWAERVRYAEAVAGLSMMRDAAAGLKAVALRRGDATRAARIDAFDRSLVSLQRQRMQPVWNAVGTLDAAAIAAHAGDVYALTGPGKERLWRVEAALALGRCRYNAARLADQLAAPTRLRLLATTDTDPAVRAAADAAERLTLEQFRLLQ